MSIAEEIFEQAKVLPPSLQREALDFVLFLAERQRPVDPHAPEFTTQLMAAFAEAKAEALKASPPGA
jgi:hypothetical protein